MVSRTVLSERAGGTPPRHQACCPARTSPKAPSRALLASLGALNIFQFPRSNRRLISLSPSANFSGAIPEKPLHFGSFARSLQRLEAGELFALQKFERRAAARGDVRDLLCQPAWLMALTLSRRPRRSSLSTTPPCVPLRGCLRRMRATRTRPWGHSRTRSARGRARPRTARASSDRCRGPIKFSGKLVSSTWMACALSEKSVAATWSTGRSSFTRRASARSRTSLATLFLSPLDLRLSDRHAFGGEECVGHRAADEQRIDLREQGIDHRDLVRDLGATEHRDERLLRRVDQRAQVLDLSHHQQPCALFSDEPHHARRRRMRAVRSSEGVIDVHGKRPGKAARKTPRRLLPLLCGSAGSRAAPLGHPATH